MKYIEMKCSVFIDAYVLAFLIAITYVIVNVLHIVQIASLQAATIVLNNE